MPQLKQKKQKVKYQARPPTAAKSAEVPATQSPKYCVVCTPVGKLCPNEYPITSDWQDDLEEGEESQEQVKEEDNISVCSDWDADLQEQEWEYLEMKEQKNNDSKTPQPSPKPSSVDTFVHKPSNKQLNNQFNASSEAEDQKFDNLATLLGHKTQKF